MNFEKIKNRDNKPVKFKDIPYPQCRGEDLPKNFFTALFIGGTGSGKTNALVKLLKYYEKEKMYSTDGTNVLVEQRIIIISPTFKSNTIFLTLKNLDVENDVHEDDYTNAMLKGILDDVDNTIKEALEYQKILTIWKKFKKVKKISLLSNFEIMMLEMIDYDINNVEKPRYEVPPVTHIILDDLVAGPAYRPSSLVANLSVRNRHKYINLYILSQSAKQVNKIIRIQARVMVLYRFNSKNICDDLYELVSRALTPEQFQNMYMTITEEPYQYFVCDNTKPVMEFKKNFEFKIILDKKNNVTEIK
jgi:hypothetical protein